MTEEKFAALDESKRRELRDNGMRIQERWTTWSASLKAEERATKDSARGNWSATRRCPVSDTGSRRSGRNTAERKLLTYLDAVHAQNVLASIEDFKGGGEEARSSLPFREIGRQEPDFSRYSVNVIVNNGEANGLLRFREQPDLLQPLRADRATVPDGAALTDFTMIKSGALHKANGGFLVINALDLLRKHLLLRCAEAGDRNRG